MFSKNDLEQIQQKGIAIDLVNRQIECFVKGFPYLEVVKPATPSDGIICFENAEIANLLLDSENQMQEKRIEKFVPASGAATRMFKPLYEHLSKPSQTELHPDVSQVIDHLHKFAFHNDLKDTHQKKGQDLLRFFVQTLLSN